MAERELIRDTYPSNSHKQKEESSKKPDPVVKGKVRKVKRPVKGFFKEDASSILGYVVTDVIFPKIKDLVWESISNGVEMALYGEVKGRRSRSNDKFTNYGKYFKEDGSRRDRDRRRQARGDLEDLWFEDKWEAMDILENMIQLIEVNDEATVQDLYEQVGITVSPSDQDYGWTNLSRARVLTARGGGYILDLPRPKYLD